MDRASLTDDLKSQANRLGFELVGVCPATSPAGYQHLKSWLESGYAGEMHYLADRVEAYRHPRHVLDGVRSLLMLGMNYRSLAPQRAVVGQGRVSRYAWGAADYHDVVHQRLRKLRDWLNNAVPQARVRGVVDTAPLLEREFAQLAGLGWIGKNTMLINRRQGSWFFLAALLTDLVLEYDRPFTANHCGTCRACLDACPTQAFPEPFVLDASRCISFLTIELRGEIPLSLRSGISSWLFGCDICQEVCPWNRRAPQSDEQAFWPQPENNPLDLIPLFFLDGEAFRERFRRTPLWRAKRQGILRNAAIVLGNQRNEEALPALRRGLQDAEPLIREACQWAIGQIENRETA